MAGRRRISELARELGVAPAEVLAKLAEMGEYVKSAASTIEAPVERKIRESFPVPAAPTTDQVRQSPARTPAYDAAEWRRETRESVLKRMDDPFDPLYTPLSASREVRTRALNRPDSSTGSSTSTSSPGT